MISSIMTLHTSSVSASDFLEARNHIEMAGLSHVVTVQLGHSDDAVQLVLEKHGERSVDMASSLQREL